MWSQEAIEYAYYRGGLIDKGMINGSPALFKVWEIGGMIFDRYRTLYAPPSDPARIAPPNSVTPQSGATAEFLVLDDQRITASASKRINRTHYISGSKIVPIVVYDLALCMTTRFCRSKDVFPVFMSGEASLGCIEAIATDRIAGLPTDAQQRLATGLLPHWDEVEKNLSPGFKLFFKSVVRYAYSFIFWHELAHIHLGHTDVIDRVLGFDEIEEGSYLMSPRHGTMQQVGRGGVKELQRFERLRQWHEYQADMFAAERLLHDAYASVPNGHESSAEESLVDSIVQIVCGFIIVALIFHVARELAPAMEGRRDHPPFWFRARAFLQKEAHVRRQLLNDCAGRQVGANSNLRQLTGMLQGIAEMIASVHPLCADFVATATDPFRQSVYIQYLQELRLSEAELATPSI